MIRKKEDGNERSPRIAPVAFLLAQVGAHAAAAFAGRLDELGLAPHNAGILRQLMSSEGLSQQALSKRLQILPSRLVAFVDELEQRGLVERRRDPSDRRTHALYLTAAGRQVLAEIREIAQEHERALCAALSPEEKGKLAEMLARMAEQQGLTAGVHPGYQTLGRVRTSTDSPPDQDQVCS